MNIQSIKAVSSQKPLTIEAALQNPAVKANARLLASIGIERPTGRISMRELEAKMAAADLPTQKKLELKILLERVGLISEI
jgi:hypothetical protein